MKKEKPGKEVTVKGFVSADEWNGRKNVIAISITTDDEDYRVELDKVGEELFDYLDEDVEVTGTIRQEKNPSEQKSSETTGSFLMAAYSAAPALASTTPSTIDRS